MNAVRLHSTPCTAHQYASSSLRGNKHTHPAMRWCGLVGVKPWRMLGKCKAQRDSSHLASLCYYSGEPKPVKADSMEYNNQATTPGSKVVRLRSRKGVWNGALMG